MLNQFTITICFIKLNLQNVIDQCTGFWCSFREGEKEPGEPIGSMPKNPLTVATKVLETSSLIHKHKASANNPSSGNEQRWIRPALHIRPISQHTIPCIDGIVLTLGPTTPVLQQAGEAFIEIAVEIVKPRSNWVFYCDEMLEISKDRWNLFATLGHRLAKNASEEDVGEFIPSLGRSSHQAH